MTKTSASSFLIAILFSAAAHAEAPAGASSSVAAPTYTLTMTVEGVRTAEGQIMAQLLKADDTTGTAPPLFGIRAPAIAGVTALSFTGLEAGDYAVRVFHDEDSDGEMKTNAFGMPKEGFGFSNRAKARFGPPDFKDMKVSVSADTATSAVMSY